MSNNFLNILKRKKLILRGTGKEAEIFYVQWNYYLKFIRKYLDDSFNDIERVMDNNPQKYGQYFNNIKIEKNIEKYEENIFFIVGVYKNEDVFFELSELGYKKYIDFEYQYLFLKKFRSAISDEILNIILDNNIINASDFDVKNNLFSSNENMLLVGSTIYKEIEQIDIENEEKNLMLELFLENILKHWLKLDCENKQLSDLTDYFPLSGIISGLYMILDDNIKSLEPLYQNYISSNKNKKKIKTIGIYSLSYSYGGAQRVLSILIPMFVELGINIVLFTDCKDDDEYNLPENVVRIDLKNLLPYQFKQRLETYCYYIKKYSIDMFFFNTNKHDITYFYEPLYFKMLNLPIITEVHNTFLKFIRPELLGLDIWQQIYRIMDKIVTLSRTDKTFWETLSCNAKYIPNPIEYGRKHWNLPISFNGRNGKTVIWVGRISENIKHVFDTIGIMEEVRKKIPDAVLKIVGKTDGLENFYKVVKEKHLENNVNLCGYHSDVGEFYEEADITLITSEYEGFLMVMTESKLRGVPVVMYELPYLETTRDLRGIIEVRQRDTKAAANAIIKILNDDKLRHRMSIEAKRSLYPFIFYDTKSAWQEIFDEISS